MRWLLRLILFWGLMTPISYYFGLPIALEKLGAKAQAQAFDECQKKLTAEGTMGGANSPLSPQQGLGYCHCLSDKLVLTKADLLDALQHKPPAALNAFAQAEADRCGRQLQDRLGRVSQEPAITPANEMIKL